MLTLLRFAGALWLLVFVGCGASPRGTARLEGSARGVESASTPLVGPGSRLFFEAEGDQGRDLTVAVSEVLPRFAFELACGHIARGRPLEHATTASVSTSTLEGGRNEYSVTGCDSARERDGDSLPLFLVSRHVAQALAHRERTTVRREHQERDLALMPVGREVLRVRVDGRDVDVPTVHATGPGIDLWIATGDTPIVVRLEDEGRGFTLTEVDTGSGARAQHGSPGDRL